MTLLSKLVLASLAVTNVNAAALRKRNSNSWAGANLYYLQGLDDSAQDSYLQSLASSGAKVVRVWVNGQPGGGTCEKGSNIANSSPELETTIGQYNTATLDLLDTAISKIASNGMKALISPHDANLLDGPNGNDIYGQTYGSGDFYNDATAASQYDARLSYILNYVSPSSGQTWGNWSSAIMGFDIENEPMSVGDKASYGDPNGWMCGRAQTIRSILGDDNPIKIGTGGIGGDYSHNYNFASFATSCDQIDMISVHRYADGGWEESNWLNNANGKLVYVEEWGISASPSDGSTQSDEYSSNGDQMNGQGLPWIYWQVLPPQQCSSDDTDTFGIYQDGEIDISSPMQAAASTQAAQDWTGIVW